MSAQIEYIDAASHQFRTITIGAVEQPATQEEASAILTRFKIKHIRVTKWRL